MGDDRAERRCAVPVAVDLRVHAVGTSSPFSMVNPNELKRVRQAFRVPIRVASLNAPNRSSR